MDSSVYVAHARCYGHFLLKVYREEKSLRHVAMVAKVLDDNKPIKSLKSLFALVTNFTDLIQFHLIWQNFLWDRVYRYLSLKQEKATTFVFCSPTP